MNDGRGTKKNQDLPFSDFNPRPGADSDPKRELLASHAGKDGAQLLSLVDKNCRPLIQPFKSLLEPSSFTLVPFLQINAGVLWALFDSDICSPVLVWGENDRREIPRRLLLAIYEFQERCAKLGRDWVKKNKSYNPFLAQLLRSVFPNHSNSSTSVLLLCLPPPLLPSTLSSPILSRSSNPLLLFCTQFNHTRSHLSKVEVDTRALWTADTQNTLTLFLNRVFSNYTESVSQTRKIRFLLFQKDFERALK
ncbi:hypothetical protein BLNAU_22376 [Blattamonas nauphoetae]|uniref:Uncharacterized protein n=1 Tax=Blattamonas nauphoetae TaxID=2049346 RepID=A0ABQ9WT93_9EUKA|nr:hypothetical protein BLNAU_22376 [Blattamonas nauphoetae]